MTTSRPTFAALRDRVQEIAEFHGGVLPREDALAWAGYVAALLEWSLIDAETHRRLQELLGAESAGPTLAIFLGPEEAKEALQGATALGATALGATVPGATAPVRTFAVGGV